MFNLKKPSVILAIAGVLGLSILGGILIRNKIIWDNWLYQQLYIYNKQVKNLESEINSLETNLDKHTKYKENLYEKIKSQKENVEQLKKTINKYQENIKKLESIKHSIPFKKSRILVKAITKSKKLIEKLPQIEAKKELLNQKLSELDDYQLINNIEELIKKILDLNETLKEQKEILKEHATNRIKFNRFIKEVKKIYEHKLEQKSEITQKIRNNNDSLNSVDNLISSLTISIGNKKKELEDLFLKNPLYY